MPSLAVHRLVFSLAFVAAMAVFAATGAHRAEACCPPAPDDAIEWVSSALDIYPVTYAFDSEGGRWRRTVWADQYRPDDPIAPNGFVITYTARYKLYDGAKSVQRSVVALDGSVTLTPNPRQYDHCWTRFMNVTAPTMSSGVECGRLYADSFSAPVSIWKGDCGTTLESVTVEVQQVGLARALPQPAGSCDRPIARLQPLHYTIRYAPPWNRSLEQRLPLYFVPPLY
jgi:hypothetical protein